ncbi:conjugal transfer mating pair stabilization protein TraN [Enterobacter cancerogenus]|uniref:Conjugal transfer mating pair stabilization protein TraN n=1 Tax=Enterobacter cancerogenus TaxID=69218 RepID=A0A484WVJ0_9ENTR|nr:conjugal transfer mating pair stabilization protein TraN [Enterobacter cancerogenus]
MNYTFKKDLAFSNDNWYLNITALNTTMTMYETSGSYDLPPGKTFGEGEPTDYSF